MLILLAWYPPACICSRLGMNCVSLAWYPPACICSRLGMNCVVANCMARHGGGHSGRKLTGRMYLPRTSASFTWMTHRALFLKLFQWNIKGCFPIWKANYCCQEYRFHLYKPIDNFILCTYEGWFKVMWAFHKKKDNFHSSIRNPKPEGVCYQYVQKV